jgi:hypothetical protein
MGLYTEETDFRELNSQQLKRPAVVTIRKPLIHKAEMEDVLTRLLNLYVPATKKERKVSGRNTIVVGGRALLLSYKDTTSVQSWKWVKYNENIYLRTQALQQFPVESIPLKNIVRDSAQTIEIDQVLASSVLGRFGGGDTAFSLNPTVQNINDVYKLVLFNQVDDNYLNASKDTGETQAPFLLKTPYLFKNGRLPFKLSKTVTRIDLTKETTDTTVNAIKRAMKFLYGFIPKKTISVYIWAFGLNTPAAKISVEHAVNTQIQDIRGVVCKQIAINLRDYYNAIKYSSRRLEAQNRAMELTNKEKNTFTILADIRKLDVPWAQAAKGKSYGDNLSAFLNKIEKELTVNTTYDEQNIPLLALGPEAERLYKQTCKVILADAISEQYLTTSADTENIITQGDFRVKYYAVLLKKIQDKVQAYQDLITRGIMHFPLYSTYKGVLAYDIADLLQAKDTTTLLEFIRNMESLLFGATSGLYITSQDSNTTVPTAPIWNAQAVAGDVSFGRQEWVIYPNTELTPLKQVVLNTQNQDIVNITVQRVTAGTSGCSVELKNADGKYTHEREDILNRGNSIFESLDEIKIFLPTREGTVEECFQGIVYKVQENNEAGYHSITVSAECNKRLLRMMRTNLKPSLSKDESANNPLTAFVIPTQFYNAIQYWMPFLFMQGLSYMSCQPQQITDETAYSLPLYGLEPTNITQNTTVSYTVPTSTVQKINVMEQATPTSFTPSVVGTNTLTPTQKDLQKLTKNIGLIPVDTGVPFVYASNTTAVGIKSVDMPTISITAPEDATVLQQETKSFSYKNVVGSYKQVNFIDELFNLIWYSCNSSGSNEDIQRIAKAKKQLIEEYTASAIITNAENPYKNEKDEPGITDLATVLRGDNRVTFKVYKQRFKMPFSPGTTLTYRTPVARIVGTSQPAFALSYSNQEVQFSNWKSNIELIDEVAGRFNFLFYTDKQGVINFTPYNFDLTTLATYNYTKPYVDSAAVLTIQPSIYYEGGDNPQILRKRDITQYQRIQDDSVLVNWVKVIGSWQQAGNIALNNAIVSDPVLMLKVGFRPARDVSVLGIRNTNALTLYGLAWMDRNNKRFKAADISGIFDARMDINLPYYVPHDEVIYFCEALNITYTAGQSCKYNMTGSFGKTPILDITPYVASDTTEVFTDYAIGLTLAAAIQDLFVNKTKITPSVYSQYKKIFNTSRVSAQKASICCFNGHLWDNVSAIQFEELVYNYTAVYGDKFSGIEGYVGMGITGLTDITTIINNLNNAQADTQDINAIRLWAPYIYALQDPKAPSILIEKQKVFSDLYIPGIVEEPVQTQATT